MEVLYYNRVPEYLMRLIEDYLEDHTVMFEAQEGVLRRQPMP